MPVCQSAPEFFIPSRRNPHVGKRKPSRPEARDKADVCHLTHRSAGCGRAPPAHGVPRDTEPRPYEWYIGRVSGTQTNCRDSRRLNRRVDFSFAGLAQTSTTQP